MILKFGSKLVKSLSFNCVTKFGSGPLVLNQAALIYFFLEGTAKTDETMTNISDHDVTHSHRLLPSTPTVCFRRLLQIF